MRGILEGSDDYKMGLVTKGTASNEFVTEHVRRGSRADALKFGAEANRDCLSES